MSNQRPPGGLDGPTQDPGPERPRAGVDGPAPAPPWADPNRTQRYSGRRSIVDRLKAQSKEPDRLVTADTAEPPPRPPAARPRVAAAAPLRGVRGGRSEGGLRIVLVLVVVTVLGLAGGAAAAWFSGWRPAFLSPSSEPAKTPETKPGETKPEVKPGEPATPTTPAPPASEIPRSCFTGTTELKAGAAACGFALDPAGALSFQGARIAERLAAGSGPAQRLMLYPFSPSGRFAFLRACDGGGRCDTQRLVDMKEKKIFEVRVGGGEAFSSVAWSPREQVAALGWRENLSDTIAVVTTADGKTIRPSTIRTAKNRYALVRPGSVRWTSEESFSADVKLCPPAKNRARNAECERDDDVRYRRRTVKVER